MFRRFESPTGGCGSGFRTACAFPPDVKRGYGAVMTDIVLSIVVLAAIALVAGAGLLYRRTGVAKQPLLMLLLAAIALANVAIWTVPDEEGAAPLDRIERGD